MKTLSKTLREIDTLTVEIAEKHPDLFQELTRNPLPFPQEFHAENNPHGLESFLQNVQNQLISPTERMFCAITDMENLAGHVTYDTNRFQHKVIFETDGHKTDLLAFAAGQGLAEHTTPKDALLVMLEGLCEFTMQGSGQLLKGGEVILIPAGEPHHLIAVSDFKMLLLK